MKLRYRILSAAGAALITLAVVLWWRNFFVEHAVLTGIAVGGLVYAVLSTAERWRQTYR